MFERQTGVGSTIDWELMFSTMFKIEASGWMTWRMLDGLKHLYQLQFPFIAATSILDLRNG
jgi:hypothetical protein